jgi:hypothetical protein
MGIQMPCSEVDPTFYPLKSTPTSIFHTIPPFKLGTILLKRKKLYFVPQNEKI